MISSELISDKFTSLFGCFSAELTTKTLHCNQPLAHNQHEVNAPNIIPGRKSEVGSRLYHRIIRRFSEP